MIRTYTFPVIIEMPAESYKDAVKQVEKYIIEGAEKKLKSRNIFIDYSMLPYYNVSNEFKSEP